MRIHILEKNLFKAVAIILFDINLIRNKHFSPPSLGEKLSPWAEGFLRALPGLDFLWSTRTSHYSQILKTVPEDQHNISTQLVCVHFKTLSWERLCSHCPSTPAPSTISKHESQIYHERTPLPGLWVFQHQMMNSNSTPAESHSARFSWPDTVSQILQDCIPYPTD